MMMQDNANSADKNKREFEIPLDNYLGTRALLQEAPTASMMCSETFKEIPITCPNTSTIADSGGEMDKPNSGNTQIQCNTAPRGIYYFEKHIFVQGENCFAISLVGDATLIAVPCCVTRVKTGPGNKFELVYISTTTTNEKSWVSNFMLFHYLEDAVFVINTYGNADIKYMKNYARSNISKSSSILDPILLKYFTSTTSGKFPCLRKQESMTLQPTKEALLPKLQIGVFPLSEPVAKLVVISNPNELDTYWKQSGRPITTASASIYLEDNSNDNVDIKSSNSGIVFSDTNPRDSLPVFKHGLKPITQSTLANHSTIFDNNDAVSYRTSSKKAQIQNQGIRHTNHQDDHQSLSKHAKITHKLKRKRQPLSRNRPKVVHDVPLEWKKHRLHNSSSEDDDDVWKIPPPIKKPQVVTKDYTTSSLFSKDNAVQNQNLSATNRHQPSSISKPHDAISLQNCKNNKKGEDLLDKIPKSRNSFRKINHNNKAASSSSSSSFKSSINSLNHVTIGNIDKDNNDQSETKTNLLTAAATSNTTILKRRHANNLLTSKQKQTKNKRNDQKSTFVSAPDFLLLNMTIDSSDSCYNGDINDQLDNYSSEPMRIEKMFHFVVEKVYMFMKRRTFAESSFNHINQWTSVYNVLRLSYVSNKKFLTLQHMCMFMKLLMETTISGTINPLVCYFCNNLKVYETSADMEEHFYETHAIIKTIYVCSKTDCNYSTPYPFQHYQHVKHCCPDKKVSILNYSNNISWKMQDSFADYMLNVNNINKEWTAICAVNRQVPINHEQQTAATDVINLPSGPIFPKPAQRDLANKVKGKGFDICNEDLLDGIDDMRKKNSMFLNETESEDLSMPLDAESFKNELEKFGWKGKKIVTSTPINTK